MLPEWGSGVGGEGTGGVGWEDSLRLCYLGSGEGRQSQTVLPRGWKRAKKSWLREIHGSLRVLVWEEDRAEKVPSS